MSETKNESWLLRSNAHILTRRGLSYEGERVVSDCILGDLQPLYGVGAIWRDLQVAGTQHVAGNYNRARVNIRILDTKCLPITTPVEGEKREDQYQYNFSAEVEGKFAKSWPITSSRPLELRNKESYADFLTNPGNFECSPDDEEREMMDTYLPFKVTEQGGWVFVECAEGNGVYSI